MAWTRWPVDSGLAEVSVGPRSYMRGVRDPDARLCSWDRHLSAGDHRRDGAALKALLVAEGLVGAAGGVELRAAVGCFTPPLAPDASTPSVPICPSPLLRASFVAGPAGGRAPGARPPVSVSSRRRTCCAAPSPGLAVGSRWGRPRRPSRSTGSASTP